MPEPFRIQESKDWGCNNGHRSDAVATKQSVNKKERANVRTVTTGDRCERWMEKRTVVRKGLWEGAQEGLGGNTMCGGCFCVDFVPRRVMHFGGGTWDSHNNGFLVLCFSPIFPWPDRIA